MKVSWALVGTSFNELDSGLHEIFGRFYYFPSSTTRLPTRLSLHSLSFWLGVSGRISTSDNAWKGREGNFLLQRLLDIVTFCCCCCMIRLQIATGHEVQNHSKSPFKIYILYSTRINIEYSFSHIHDLIIIFKLSHVHIAVQGDHSGCAKTLTLI